MNYKQIDGYTTHIVVGEGLAPPVSLVGYPSKRTVGTPVPTKDSLILERTRKARPYGVTIAFPLRGRGTALAVDEGIEIFENGRLHTTHIVVGTGALDVPF